MALADNIRAGEQAVTYVKSRGVLACNKVGDRLKTVGGVDEMIELLRPLPPRRARLDDVHEAYDPVRTTRWESRGFLAALTIENMRGIADCAIRNRAGNCMEQAMIALVYLYDLGNVRPLDLLAFSSEGYDHCWVGIGLHAGWQPDNLRSWGVDAVWCDPWQGDGIAFAIMDFVQGKVRNLNAQFNCNTIERVERGRPVSMFRQA